MNKNTIREEIIKEIEDFLKNDYGSSAKRTGLPKSVEIHCVKDGIDSYFCVMAVSYNEQKGAYFDATVSSEWEFIKEMQKVGKKVMYVIYRKDLKDKERRKTVQSDRSL